MSPGSNNGTVSGTPTPALQENPATVQTVCNCISTESASSDFRHDAKHVPIRGDQTPNEISVDDILNWAPGPEPGFSDPRSGRELQVFHVAQAFVQFIWLVPNDCDIHMEISATPDKNAPRVIVETPVDGEFCPARQGLVTGFARFGAMVSVNGFETAAGIPVDVTGMAFRDFSHPRGTAHVATFWELHPATVNVH
jgi:hypothetical protein